MHKHSTLHGSRAPRLSGRVPRQYRHDLDGYAWTLPWIFAQYDENNEFQPHVHMLYDWQSRSLGGVSGAKLYFGIYGLGASEPQKVWAEMWLLARALGDWIVVEMTVKR